MAGVELRDVHKSFDGIEVIRGVTVEIPDGQCVVLVGPSGCGKSTLLRMIAGLEEVTHGEVRIDGRVVNDVPPKARDVAMVFQNYALYPHMTVAANMGFSLRMRGEHRDVIADKVRAAATILGLEAHLERLPRQLSGGQRQRVAMGRAIVRAPKVFLFDEPLSNLDATLRVQMRGEIKDLHQRLKTTTIYVTHDQVEAMTLADTIVVLRDGRVDQAGVPLALYDRPANAFVAGFLGSPAMNMIAGVIRASESGLALVTSDGATLHLGDRQPVREGQSVLAGIRPEHLVLGSAGVPAVVVVVEQTGSETQVVVQAADRRLVAVSRERVSPTPGEQVRLSAPPAHVHLFDEKTGRRLS